MLKPAGRAENRAGQARLAGQIAVMLGNLDTLQRMTAPQFDKIRQALMRLNVPRDYRALSPNRVVDSAQFNANKGVFCMFLMSNIPVDRSPNQPLLSWNTRRNAYGPASLLQAFKMSNNNRYLDLQDRTLETTDSLQAKGLTVPVGETTPPGPTPGMPAFDLFP